MSIEKRFEEKKYTGKNITNFENFLKFFMQNFFVTSNFLFSKWRLK